MSKDPAVLWYWNDWLGGTITLSRHLKGCYMDLLAAQNSNGRLTLEEVKTVLGSDFGSTWPTLQKKFKIDEDGYYYNSRAKEEKDKRVSYSNSRKSNRSSTTYVEHMGNGDGNEDLNKLKWKGDFEIYKKEMLEAYTKLLQDNDFITKQQKLNPGVDISLTMEKSVENFWGTEQGWENKRRSKSYTVDWKRTFVMSISSQMNKVYLPKSFQNQNTPLPKSNGKDISDGPSYLKS